MEITQMKYFINIVECGCNLSLAAKKIHISQSALSQFITNFEQSEGVKLFSRKNGRLDSLTESGELIYHYAIDISNKYEEMKSVIQSESTKQKSTIRLGVPSIILRVYLASVLPHFSIQHPKINIQVTEAGGVELRQKLIAGELNYALLIEPTGLDSKKYEQKIIQLDEYVAFMDVNHPLAQKDIMEWQDLKKYAIATFNTSFTTHQVITEKLRKEKVEAKIVHVSSSWDYLIEVTKGNHIVAILPRPVEKFIDQSQFKVVRFRDYMPFNIWFCRTYKSKYNEVEAFVYEEFLKLYYMPISN